MEAEKVLRKAIDIDPASPNAYNALAWSLAVYGTNLNEALNLARQAVEADPQNWSYLDTLAWVHFRRGEWDQAEMALKKGIELPGHDTPNDAGAWYELGRVYERKNEPLAARAAYEKALSLRPDYPQASQALQQLGR